MNISTLINKLHLETELEYTFFEPAEDTPISSNNSLMCGGGGGGCGGCGHGTIYIKRADLAEIRDKILLRSETVD
jgi:hypothetical protein